MTDIFVSYSREDRDRVAKLVSALRAKGWSVWWDPTIAFGSDYAEAIETALQEARCVLVVWSEASIGSHWVREEAAIGRTRGVLIPVRIDEVQAPIGFRNLQTADLVGWESGSEAESAKLIAELERMLEGEGSAGEPLTPPPLASPPGPPMVERPPQWRRAAWGAAAALVVLAFFGWWLWRGEPPPPPAGVEPATGIAVLGFENQTGDPQLSYIGAGLAAGVIGRLAELPGVNVVSRAKVRSLLQGKESVTQAAEALQVNLVVEGDVQARDGGLRVDIRVSDGATARVLWAGGFNGEKEDLYGLQQDIALSLERVLSVPMSGADRKRFAALSEGGPATRAFNYYLQGLERLDSLENPRNAEYAEDLFRQAISIDGDFAVFHAALSDAIWTQSRQGSTAADLAEAEAEAKKALELDPRLPQAHLAYARAIRDQGQIAESIAALRPVLSEHPKPDEAFRALAVSYEVAGDLEAAGEAYQMATTLGPDNWFNWNERGSFLALHGDFDEAREVLEEAARLAPESVYWPELNLATLKLSQGDLEGAIQDFESIGGITSDDELASNMATAYFFQGRLEEAAALYRRAVELAPDDHVNHRNLGDALEASGRDEEARAEFREARRLAERGLERSPRSNKLGAARALYAAKMGDCASAVPMALELQPLLADNWSDRLNLAAAFALCGRREEALAEIEACVDLGVPGSMVRMQAELAGLMEDPSFLEITREQ